MAVAFYIPDQEELLRRSVKQEQEILRRREQQWKLLALVILDTFKCDCVRIICSIAPNRISKDQDVFACPSSGAKDGCR